LRRTLGVYRAGHGDPTTRLDHGRFLHATHTPDGPGTVIATWTDDPAPVDACGLHGEAWGPGGSWLLDRLEAMCGTLDPGLDVRTRFPAADPIVVRCLDATRTRRVGSSGNLYHLLLPTILAQRITAGEALRQWAALVRALGEPAPGPAELVSGLLLPPAPSSLRGRPAWWFHPLGVEAKRARALTEVARHPARLWEWADAGSATAAEKLSLLPGIGAWTIGSVLGAALGDTDAVAVGDYHLPNVVAWNLAGEARADDDRMLELLEPYRGERGRVLQAVASAGKPPPAFGPKQRIVPIARL
jgi:3-methyladenine DNA glycosylase/8-oxoguanine DNA glycosylase